MDSYKQLCQAYQSDMIQFLQQLIGARSYTGQEREAARLVRRKMEELGYDRILETELGDVIGVIGDGETAILFDSHMDTVVVNDAEAWSHPPFAGEIEDGKLYGRGASDMKCAIASSVYAGFFAKKLGLLEGKTLYISVSVMEEDFDAYALRELLKTLPRRPAAVVICEPSDRKIALGHRGRALLELHTTGVSAHGSAPENGENAVYKAAELITRVDRLNRALYEKEGPHGSVVLSKIESTSVSLNAVPDHCTLYLDRRLAAGETYEVISREMEELVAGTDATWRVYDAEGTSYTGKHFAMHSFMEYWDASAEAPVAAGMRAAFEETTGQDATFFYWNFSTNGFASAGMGIPTIGYGPGVMKCCHIRDEYCVVRDVWDAAEIYTRFIRLFAPEEHT